MQELDPKQVGRTLADMPLGDIIESLAISIADAQMALDRHAIDAFNALAADRVNLQNPDKSWTNVSPLELGFAPSFYQFESVTIEITVDIKVHIENMTRVAAGFGSPPPTTGQPSTDLRPAPGSTLTPTAGSTLTPPPGTAPTPKPADVRHPPGSTTNTGTIVPANTAPPPPPPLTPEVLDKQPPLMEIPDEAVTGDKDKPGDTSDADLKALEALIGQT